MHKCHSQTSSDETTSSRVPACAGLQLLVAAAVTCKESLSRGQLVQSTENDVPGAMSC
jgi:hypothetical protein